MLKVLLELKQKIKEAKEALIEYGFTEEKANIVLKEIFDIELSLTKH